MSKIAQKIAPKPRMFIRIGGRTLKNSDSIT